MQQTANYQLNQWDGEDRIMRVDFNSDNAKIDAALQQNAAALSQATADLQSALETERQARASGDTAASQATASAKQELLNAISAEQSARSSGDAAIRGEFAAADAAIRQEFAAADAAVSAACPIFKIQSIVTSQAATQIDLDLRDASYRNLAFLLLIPQVNTSSSAVYLRVNGISANNYYVGSTLRPFLSYFNPCNPTGNKPGYAICRLALYTNIISCVTQNVSYDGGGLEFYTSGAIVNPNIAKTSALQTLNVVTEDGGLIDAGSRFTLYGMRF